MLYCNIYIAIKYYVNILHGEYMSSITEITDDIFGQEVLGSDRPVIVDFRAPWCYPCNRLAPVLEEVATRNKESWKIVTINMETNRGSLRTYNVKSIPSLLFFIDGKEVNRLIGIKTVEQIENVMSLFTEV